MEFVDIHSHYAWEIDDGMPSLEDAKQALQEAKKQNITHIVATPHLIPKTTTALQFESIKKRIKELQSLAQDYQITVYPGCEIMLNSDYLDLFESQQYLTLNDTNYVLVEFNVTQKLPADFQERLYEMKLRHQVIIAHVERYFHQGLDQSIIDEWIEQGYLLQINSTSILGVHGSIIQENAFELLKQGHVALIANDVHRFQGKRGVNLQQTYDLLTKKYQHQDIMQLMYDNPLNVINDQMIRPVFLHKKSKLSWLKRRK